MCTDSFCCAQLGDVLVLVGWYMLCKNWVPWLVPLAVLLSVVFVLIPRVEQSLSDRFGDEWREYSKKTACFIPLIY